MSSSSHYIDSQNGLVNQFQSQESEMRRNEMQKLNPENEIHIKKPKEQKLNEMKLNEG